ncbi:hypothetical protein CAEBREN_28679 [Caenorhabditis brenneri]|uniref:Uncharacterized protein n=1 Tax=Caenorhabditis brenneri TaxID=135651 RepID=G0P5Q3_CAEBE|nr:hypothetical protein CAEBREN_28679 [Caenorhabditis brenneri]
MSYGKYVLLSIEEHQDLVANRKKEDPIQELLDAPMESDLKVAHLQNQLTRMIKRRLDDSTTAATVETEKIPEKIAKLDDDKKGENDRNDDILHEAPQIPAFSPDSFATPTERVFSPLLSQSPVSPLSPTFPASLQTATIVTPTQEEAKRRLLQHLNSHPDYYRIDTKSGDFFLRGRRVPGYTIHRILDDFTNKNPISTPVEGLRALSMYLKETDFPEKYILNPKRKYAARASSRLFYATLWSNKSSGKRKATKSELLV